MPKTWYPDGDFDGHGSPFGAVVACDQPATVPGVMQWVELNDDCRDDNPLVHPGQTMSFPTGYTLGSGGSAGSTSTGPVSFDYDCSGAEDHAAVPLLPDCMGLAPAQCGGSGYLPVVPARSGLGVDAYCGSTQSATCMVVGPKCKSSVPVDVAPLSCK